MKVAITLVGGNLSSSRYSHKAGWAHLWACQLKNKFGFDVTVITENQSWNHFDRVYLYHSMEFQGTLNLFGGASEESAKFYERIITVNPNVELISLDIPMPDYGTLCKGRLKSCEDYWRNVNWDAVTEKCKTIPHFTQADLKLNSLIVGDSHAFSVYDGKSMVLRKDGRTLNGVLKKSIKKEILDHGFDLDSIDTIISYYGNIDIRHHIMRNFNVVEYVEMLVKSYEKSLQELGKKIKIVFPLPIEDESRRLPKTGYFEGTPFFGSTKERQEVVRVFSYYLSEMCSSNKWETIKWPTEWYTISPLSYMKDYMERPKSVHLAPIHHKWNYWDNKPNSVTPTTISLKNF